MLITVLESRCGILPLPLLLTANGPLSSSSSGGKQKAGFHWPHPHLPAERHLLQKQQQQISVRFYQYMLWCVFFKNPRDVWHLICQQKNSLALECMHDMELVPTLYKQGRTVSCKQAVNVRIKLIFTSLFEKHTFSDAEFACSSTTPFFSTWFWARSCKRETMRNH